MNLKPCCNRYLPSFNIDFNRYLRLPVKENNKLALDSSNERLQTFAKYPKPKTKEDVIKMLGDQSAKVHMVFRENGGKDIIKTIAVGMCLETIKRTNQLY